MVDPQRDYQQIAHELWKRGDISESGRVLFQGLPAHARPYWAAAVLNFAVAHSEVWKCAIWELQLAAKHRWRWGGMHTHFDRIRDVVLRLERRKSLTPRQQRLLLQCLLAELVAKVLYNVTDPVDPFDEDSGEWIVPVLRQYLDFVNDPQVERDAVQLLFEWDWNNADISTPPKAARF